MNDFLINKLASRNLDKTLCLAFLINERIRNNYYDYQRRRKDPSWFRKKEARLYRGIRDSLLDRLGGKCIKCGFTDKRALQLDHINGNIKREKMGRSLYKRLIDTNPEDLKKDYQVLCANCNWIKRFENNEVAYRRTIL